MLIVAWLELPRSRCVGIASGTNGSRVCKDHTCRRQMGRHKSWSSWSRFEHFIHKKGQQWYGWGQVWQEDTVETYGSRVLERARLRRPGSALTSRPAGKRRINEYGWRMRVEATFQASPSRGWDIEARKTQESGSPGAAPLSALHGDLVGQSSGR